jgi:hypothetical protein
MVYGGDEWIYILETQDANEMLSFSNPKRQSVMEAIECLSKCQEPYNIRKEIKERDTA